MNVQTMQAVADLAQPSTSNTAATMAARFTVTGGAALGTAVRMAVQLVGVMSATSDTIAFTITKA